MTFYPSTQLEMQGVIDGLIEGNLNATKTAIALLERMQLTLPSHDQETCCSHCGNPNLTNPVEIPILEEQSIVDFVAPTN